MVEVLLSYGVYPDPVNQNGETPLFHAIENHNVEMVKLLLEYGKLAKEFE